MTETGSIMGTAQYLSPEQAQGHAVDARVRPLLGRDRPLRAADRPRAVRRRLGGDDRAQAGLRGAGAAVGAQPGGLRPARGRRAARAGEGPGAPLRRRRRVHRRARGTRAGSPPRAPATYTRIAPHTGDVSAACRRRRRARARRPPQPALAAGGCWRCSRAGRRSRSAPTCCSRREKVAVPDVVGATLGRPRADPPERRLRGERRERAPDSVPARPVIAQRPQPGEEARGGLDGHADRLERAGRRHGPGRARRRRGRRRSGGSRPRASGSTCGARQRRRAREPGDRDVAARALAARARAHGDARRLERARAGRGARRRRPRPRRRRAALEARGLQVAVTDARDEDEEPGTVLADAPGGGQRGRPGRDGHADRRRGAAAGRGARRGRASERRRRGARARGGGLPRAPRASRRSTTPDEDGIVLDQTPPAGERARQGLAR